jgi:predicted nucleotidyltransferase
MSNKPQSWQVCDEDIKKFVLDLVSLLENELRDNLVGVYLHGSLAMGCYYRPKSDLDVIVVVQDKIGAATAKSAGIAIAEQAEKRPTTGNVELSIITADTAKNIPVPVPFEFHYSTEWHEKTLNGDIEYDSSKTDIDLLSHLMYVRQRGVVLAGKPISEVFGEYDWQHFMDAVIDDFKWILEDEHILETPFYGVLNICRVLQLMSENSQMVHSKDEGGEWGLKNLPQEHHAIIQQALDAYRSSVEVNEEQRRAAGQSWDKDRLIGLRDFARMQRTSR